MAPSKAGREIVRKPHDPPLPAANVYLPPKKKRKKTLKWLFKAFTMQAASYMCVCARVCVYMCVSMYMQLQLTSAHTDPHTWRHTQSPHRNPHTSRSSQKTLSYSNSSHFSVSLLLSRPLFPPFHCLIPAHTSAPLKTVQNSALLASGFSFLSFLFVVFFVQAKDFACGYNMDMSHAHRSHRPIAVIVGQSYCHISGLITTAICGSYAGRQTGCWDRKKSFSRFFRFSLTGKMPKSNRQKLSKKIRFQ